MAEVYLIAVVYDCSMEAMRHIQLRDLGRMSYAEAFALQKRLQAAVIEAREAKPMDAHPWDKPGVGYLLFVEHDPPVITVSRRKTARQHLVATPQQLAAVGVEVAETDRGGDITYHGPGQLVVYPIVDLNVLGLRLHGYMRLLEQVVIDTLAHFGIQAHRDPDATGVWVETSERPNVQTSKEAHGWQSVGSGGGAAKICAMGVRVSRWVTMHGLALNVTTNLDNFNLIIPCGLAGRSVTSIQQQLGPDAPNMDEVKQVMADQFARHFKACAMSHAP